MLFSLLLLLPLISAQTAPTFVGCTSVRGQINPASGGGYSSAAQCASACAGVTSRQYSYYQASAAAGTANCFCSAEFPSAATMTSSVSEATPDVCQSPSDYSAYRLYTAFVFDRCYTGGLGPVDTPGFVGVVQTLDECFTQCRGSTAMLFTPGVEGFNCDCSTYAAYFNFATCSPNSGYYRFDKPYSAASAQVARKRKAEARRAHSEVAGSLAGGQQGVMRLKQEYCPAGMAACKVMGSDEGYECIDTSNELESCGGCMYGEYGAVGGTMGVNCAALENSAFGVGSMTCRKGQCVELA